MIFKEICSWQTALAKSWSQVGPADLLFAGFDKEIEKTPAPSLLGSQIMR